MLNCPRCQSPNIASNKLNNGLLSYSVQVAHASREFENKRIGALGGIFALAVKAIDTLRSDCVCIDCGQKFDV